MEIDRRTMIIIIAIITLIIGLNSLYLSYNNNYPLWDFEEMPDHISNFIFHYNLGENETDGNFTFQDKDEQGEKDG